MILCVCLNPALDVTYRVASLEPGASHSVQVVAEHAGGKGVNVARVLHQVGAGATVAGFCGGLAGDEVAADLRRSGIATQWTPIGGHTRRTVTVVSDAATVFNEPGPSVETAEWEAFLAAYPALAADATVVVLSGSLPPGVPTDAYRQLTELTDRPVIVDAKGAPLQAALHAKPDIVAPNVSEAAEMLGRDVGAHDAAHALRDMGAQVAVVSDGAAGFAAVTPDACHRVPVARLVDGNPTGAGDAMTAAIAEGVHNGRSWHETLRRASAWASAAVAVEYAGRIDTDLAAELMDHVDAEETPCP